jgi:hypothetical protein
MITTRILTLSPPIFGFVGVWYILWCVMRLDVSRMLTKLAVDGGGDVDRVGYSFWHDRGLRGGRHLTNKHRMIEVFD